MITEEPTVRADADTATLDALERYLRTAESIADLYDAAYTLTQRLTSITLPTLPELPHGAAELLEKPPAAAPRTPTLRDEWEAHIAHQAYAWNRHVTSVRNVLRSLGRVH